MRDYRNTNVRNYYVACSVGEYLNTILYFNIKSAKKYLS